MGASVAWASSCGRGMNRPACSPRRVSTMRSAPIAAMRGARVSAVSSGAIGISFCNRMSPVSSPAVDPHGGHAGDGFAAGNRPLNRRRAAIFRQQRCVQVEIAQAAADRSSTAGMMRPYPTTIIASGLMACSCARNSSLFLILSGWLIGKPSCSARCFTGEGASSMPRPFGRSGWVTTRRTGKPASTSFSRVGTANAGVPQKTRVRKIRASDSDRRDLGLTRVLLRNYRIDGQTLTSYHSPAFISLRIFRFMKSRFRALMWLMYSLPFR